MKISPSNYYSDTHAHLHDPEFFSVQEAEAAYEKAVGAGVGLIVCVGTSLEDSHRAVAFAQAHAEHCVASVGIHPHEASSMSATERQQNLVELRSLAQLPGVVAIGECGLDLFYHEQNDVPTQEALLRGQLEIAKDLGLPVLFHVRDAYNEFWPIYEEFAPRGVLHSFTDSIEHLERARSHGLLIGVNGIATFTNDSEQQVMFASLHPDEIVLETDAPFLTPRPKRGKMNEPMNVIYITEHLASLNNHSVESLARSATKNAMTVLNLE